MGSLWKDISRLCKSVHRGAPWAQLLLCKNVTQASISDEKRVHLHPPPCVVFTLHLFMFGLPEWRRRVADARWRCEKRTKSDLIYAWRKRNTVYVWTHVFCAWGSTAECSRIMRPVTLWVCECVWICVWVSGKCVRLHTSLAVYL